MKHNELLRRDNGNYTPRGNGQMPVFKDSTNQIFGITYWRLLAYTLAVIGAGATAGSAYSDLTSRLSTVECQVQMLVDVVVYKDRPKQPRCK